MNFLVNASNLHVGGGVQVATSAICEFSRDRDIAKNITVWVSSEVNSNLALSGCNQSIFLEFRVLNSRGVNTFFSSAFSNLREFDVVFTVFGPLYSIYRPRRSVVGFANPYIINNDKSVYTRLFGFVGRLRVKLIFWLQSMFFRQADRLIVELEHVKRELLLRGFAPAEGIDIVHNCLSSIYQEPWRWKPVDVADVKTDLKIGFVGRNYPHKNTRIFPLVKSIMKERFGLRVAFYVTFTEEEWSACNSTFQQAVVNVGALSVTQCPSFYQAMDGVIFPSLLECFSATPLESMAMGKPLFASDRAFNRDICGNNASYFDPYNPEDVASVIYSWYINDESREQVLNYARDRALEFGNASTRADQYFTSMLGVPTNQ